MRHEFQMWFEQVLFEYTFLKFLCRHRESHENEAIQK